jgi:hypothetical protein
MRPPISSTSWRLMASPIPALDLARIRQQAREGLEHLLATFGGNAHARIGERRIDGDRPRFTVVFEGIGKDVEENLPVVEQRVSLLASRTQCLTTVNVSSSSLLLGNATPRHRDCSRE